MGAVENKARTETALRGIRKLAAERQLEWKALEAQFKAVGSKLAASLKQPDARMLRLHELAVQAEARKAALLHSRCEKLLGDIDALANTDEGFVDDLAEVEKLTAALSAIARGSSVMFKAAKKLEAAARKQLEELEKQQDKNRDHWAEIDALMRKGAKERSEAVRYTNDLRARADKAVAARDGATLAALQKDNALPFRFGVPLESMRGTQREIGRFVDVDQLDADLRKEFEDDQDAWGALLEQVEADEATIARVTKEIAALALAPRDAGKAARLLGIATADVAKLAKVLEAEANAMLKGLEQLRKQLQLEMSAKDMFATLKRAKLV